MSLLPVKNTDNSMTHNPNLNIKTTLNKPVVPFTGKPHLVYLLVEIDGGESAQTLPMNLGLLIDVSKSMHIRMVSEEQFKEMVGRGHTKEILTDGIPAWEIKSAPREMINQLPRKIDYVREALFLVSEYLRQGDYYSLIAFADRPVKLIPMSTGKERGKLNKQARELEYLDLGDETLMAEGLAMVLNELQDKKTGNLADRIILLTDGYTKNVKQCYKWAKKAREMSLAITTMGIGPSFNEDLLIPIAEMTGGKAYYLESPDSIPTAFRKELGSALDVRYRNLKLELKPSANVQVRNLYRVLPELGNIEGEILSDGSSLHYLGHYEPSLPPAFLFELVLPPLNKGNYCIVKMNFFWDGDRMSEEMSSFQKDVVVTVGSATSGTINKNIKAIIDKVGAYRLGNYALEYAQNSNRNDGVSLLRKAAGRLAEVGEEALSREVSNAADKLQNEGKIDPNATKRIKYDTRLITQHQSD